MRVVAISDTHCLHPEVPDGDLLIHAGDFTLSGDQKETEAAIRWFGSLPHPIKIAIAGNHDWWFYHAGPIVSQEFIDEHSSSEIVYLQDSPVLLENGLVVYGSPWQPWFYDWAFNAHRGPDIRQYWDRIPSCDILVTHGPPANILDRVGRDHVGCADLADTIARVKPRVHIFGHIHCGYGHVTHNGTDYYNASMVNEIYKLTPRQQPFVFDIEPRLQPGS